VLLTSITNVVNFHLLTPDPPPSKDADNFAEPTESTVGFGFLRDRRVPSPCAAGVPTFKRIPIDKPPPRSIGMLARFQLPHGDQAQQNDRIRSIASNRLACCQLAHRFLVVATATT
jgi:hypothetical protein